jgi:hypothetical protein
MVAASEPDGGLVRLKPDPTYDTDELLEPDAPDELPVEPDATYDAGELSSGFAGMSA